MNSHDTTSHRGRPVDPHALEALGKQAAHVSETHGIGMTDAVVQTVSHVKLNAEQVQRVVEYANLEMFNRKFASLSGQASRSVHIDGGPADPADVMQSLNDAARPREVHVDSMEYSMPPDLMKSSGLANQFELERTRAGVLGDVLRLQQKCAHAHDSLVQDVEAAKERLTERFVELIDLVKSAGAAGATPDEIFRAWHAVHPEVAKIAYAKLSPIMRQDNEKIAGRSLSVSSKIVATFRDFVKESLSVEAHTHALREVEAELARVSTWMQTHGG
jgi:hypothetical protein